MIKAWNTYRTVNHAHATRRSNAPVPELDEVGDRLTDRFEAVPWSATSRELHLYGREPHHVLASVEHSP